MGYVEGLAPSMTVAAGPPLGMQRLHRGQLCFVQPCPHVQSLFKALHSIMRAYLFFLYILRREAYRVEPGLAYLDDMYRCSATYFRPLLFKLKTGIYTLTGNLPSKTILFHLFSSALIFEAAQHSHPHGSKVLVL